MTITLQDSLTDIDGTLLTDHDPDTGDVGSWGATAFGIGGTTPNDDLIITSNRVQTVNSGSSDAIGAVCRNSTDPGSDEYNVSAKVKTRSATQNNRYTAVLGRMSLTGTSDSAVDRYLLLCNGSSGVWQLYKIVSGSLTLLDSNSANFALNTIYDVRVEFRSSGNTISVLVNDGGGFVEIITSTDTDITQRGRVGISTNRSGDGDIWIDDLTVDSVAAGAIELDVPFFQNSVQIFNSTVQKQSPLELNVPHFGNINQVFLATAGNQAALELDVPFLDSMDQIFVPQVVNEGDDLFEPILAGNGSYADQIFNGLVSQGFLTGSLADRERARLLAKLSLIEPQGLSIADLYRLASEENRLAGVLVGI